MLHVSESSFLRGYRLSMRFCLFANCDRNPFCHCESTLLVPLFGKQTARWGIRLFDYEDPGVVFSWRNHWYHLMPWRSANHQRNLLKVFVCIKPLWASLLEFLYGTTIVLASYRFPWYFKTFGITRSDPGLTWCQAGHQPVSICSDSNHLWNLRSHNHRLNGQKKLCLYLRKMCQSYVGSYGESNADSCPSLLIRTLKNK